MAKLQVPVKLSRDGKHGITVQAIVDSGSDITVFPRSVARLLHLRLTENDSLEKFEIMGSSLPIWFVQLNVQVPDTDCFQEFMQVGFVASKNKNEDLLHGILGADFLQLTGGTLDFRKDNHAICCDISGRGKHSDVPVHAKRQRIKAF